MDRDKLEETMTIFKGNYMVYFEIKTLLESSQVMAFNEFSNTDAAMNLMIYSNEMQLKKLGSNGEKSEEILAKTEEGVSFTLHFLLI